MRMTGRNMYRVINKSKLFSKVIRTALLNSSLKKSNKTRIMLMRIPIRVTAAEMILNFLILVCDGSIYSVSAMATMCALTKTF